MTTRMFLSAAIIAASAAIAALDTAAAQGMSRMPGGMDQQQPADHGMMQGGMGRDMMCPMMRSGMMQGGMMGSGMMLRHDAQRDGCAVWIARNAGHESVGR